MEKLFHRRLPPGKGGETVVVNAVTGAAAASLDWPAGLGSIPEGRVWIEVQATTTDAWVRFGPTSTTATTQTNGWRIPVNTTERFYVDPVAHKYIDHISTGAGVVKVRVCSPIGERNYD